MFECVRVIVYSVCVCVIVYAMGVCLCECLSVDVCVCVCECVSVWVRCVMWRMCGSEYGEEEKGVVCVKGERVVVQDI